MISVSCIDGSPMRCGAWSSSSMTAGTGLGSCSANRSSTGVATTRLLGRACTSRSVDGDDRPFMLSTPRVTTERGVVASMPLRSEAIDVLARSRFSPVALGEIHEALGPEAASSPALAGMWTEASESLEPAWSGDLRVRYFGHACLVFETSEVTVVADPFVSPRSGPDRYSLKDLPPRIDYCVITHGHADHFVIETLLALRHRIGTVIVPANLGGELLDPSLRLCLQHLGFADVVEVRDLDRIPLPGGEIVAWPFAGEHGDLAIGAKSTYVVRLGGRSTMVGADARALPAETVRARHPDDRSGGRPLPRAGMRGCSADLDVRAALSGSGGPQTEPGPSVERLPMPPRRWRSSRPSGLAGSSSTRWARSRGCST